MKRTLAEAPDADKSANKPKQGRRLKPAGIQNTEAAEWTNSERRAAPPNHCGVPLEHLCEVFSDIDAEPGFPAYP
jgi:hypothetical protein